MPIIDLNQLPAPDVVEELDFETILAERKATLISLYPEDQQEAVALLEQVRSDQLAVHASVPVAVTTAQVDASTAVKMKVLQVRRVLLKPFKVRDVITTIELLRDS